VSFWRTAHNLASCPLPTPPHTQFGEKSALPVKSPLKGGRRCELTQRKSSPGQKTVSNRKIPEFVWVRPKVQYCRHTRKSGDRPRKAGVCPQAAHQLSV
uniref:Uncharacterized protein n=1 Tax=Suricata suricatta TaxID=37032 RepID=A0A673TY38_SURSU